MNAVRVLNRFLQHVSVECMTPVTIINKLFTATAFGIFVGGYNFRNAGKRICGRRNFPAQVNQQIATTGRCRFPADRNRCRRSGGRLPEDFMGNKTTVPEGPQKIIDLLDSLSVRGDYVDGMIETIGFFGETAGESLPGLFARAADHVEINL